MPSTLSPNMSLILPTVGQEPGPNWALDLNNSLSIVDQHTHAPGSGAQISPAGININIDLPFNGNNALSLRSVRFSPQLSPLALGSDVGCLYVSGQDLYYNDVSGTQIQITALGAIAGTPGSIGNLIAPAAVTYVPANQSFVFESNQTNATPGALDCGPIYLRNITPSSNYILLSANPVLPANYSLTLPSALPANTSALLVDSLGNIATSGTANTFSATTLNASVANITTSLSIKNDNGLLEFKNTADTVQFASITASSSGLVFNLPDASDTYRFQVAGVDQMVLGGTDFWEINNQTNANIPFLTMPVTGVPVNQTVTASLPGSACLLFNLTFTSSSANSKFLITAFTKQNMTSPPFGPLFAASILMGTRTYNPSGGTDVNTAVTVWLNGPGVSDQALMDFRSFNTVGGNDFPVIPFNGQRIFSVPQAGTYTITVAAYSYFFSGPANNPTGGYAQPIGLNLQILRL